MLRVGGEGGGADAGPAGHHDQRRVLRPFGQDAHDVEVDAPAVRGRAVLGDAEDTAAGGSGEPGEDAGLQLEQGPVGQAVLGRATARLHADDAVVLVLREGLDGGGEHRGHAVDGVAVSDDEDRPARREACGEVGIRGVVLLRAQAESGRQGGRRGPRAAGGGHEDALDGQVGELLGERPRAPLAASGELGVHAVVGFGVPDEPDDRGGRGGGRPSLVEELVEGDAVEPAPADHHAFDRAGGGDVGGGVTPQEHEIGARPRPPRRGRVDRASGRGSTSRRRAPGWVWPRRGRAPRVPRAARSP